METEETLNAIELADYIDQHEYDREEPIWLDKQERDLICVALRTVQ